MADFVIPLDVNRLIADSLTAVDGLLEGAKLGLYVNDIIVGSGTVLADLTPATFTGYAMSAALVWASAIIGVDGEIHLTAPSVLFKATAVPSPSQTVYGAYLIGDPAGTAFLIAGWHFNTPVLITAKYDGVVVDVDVVIN